MALPGVSPQVDFHSTQHFIAAAEPQPTCGSFAQQHLSGHFCNVAGSTSISTSTATTVQSSNAARDRRNKACGPPKKLTFAQQKARGLRMVFFCGLHHDPIQLSNKPKERRCVSQSIYFTSSCWPIAINDSNSSPHINWLLSTATVWRSAYLCPRYHQTPSRKL